MIRGRLSLLSFLFLVSTAACRKSPAIEPGSTVKIDYTLTVDGQVVDSSKGKEPLAYVQGAGQIIPGLEEALAGSRKGDKKSVTIPPEKAYGPVNPKAVVKVPRSKLPNMPKLQVGSVITGRQGDHMVRGRVTELDSQNVTIDMNHPMAGKTLQFQVEVMDVQPGQAPTTPPQPAP